MPDYYAGYDPKYGYNHNAFATKTLPMKVLSVTNGALASAIGLVSEAVHDRKDKKQVAASPKLEQHESTDEKEALDVEMHPGAADLDVARDECDWDLDDALTEVGDHASAPTLETMDLKPPSYQTATASKLPFPVIIPQRRPGTKTRGFVRAYAPALQNCGIDQKMFLAFLKDFHTHAQASPVFQVTKIAALIAGLAPEPIVFATATAIQIAAGVGQEMQERYKTNAFLDKINKELFMPRGLYALVVTYKPSEINKPIVEPITVDIGTTALAKYGGDRHTSEQAQFSNGAFSKHDEVKTKIQQFRLASGESHESEMPMQCATLVFPGLDVIQDARYAKDSTIKKGLAQELQDKCRITSKFVGNYFDRRGQAIYATANPASTLTKQMDPAAPQFKSRYADPNDLTNKHFITLVTGGKIKAEPLGAKRRWEKAQRKAAERQTQGLKDKPKKRILQEDTLYLTIVNMPGQADLDRARAQLEQRKDEKRAART